MDLPGSLQWPAMVTTIYASWLVASRLPRRRAAGFWWFLGSNILWSRFPDRKTAIVALTGWGQDRDRDLANEAGFDHHLVKPAEIGALQMLLASLEFRRQSPSARA